MNHFYWEDVDDNHVLPLRGDGIVPEDDYESTNDRDDDDHVAAPDCDASDCNSEPREGDVRLNGGHDDTEVR